MINLTKGEKMLVNLGFECNKVKYYTTFTTPCLTLIFDKERKQLNIKPYIKQTYLTTKELKAINRIRKEYLWF